MRHPKQATLALHAGGDLEGQTADDARRIVVVGLVPFAELRSYDRVAAHVSELGGKGALADAGRAHNPEETRIELGILPPFLHCLEQPCTSIKIFAQQLADTGF